MAQPVLYRLPHVVALSAAALALAGCGANEADPHRFETLAQSVAAIPVSADEGGGDAARPAMPGRSHQRAAPLKVELMTPHELWDARDGLGAKVRRTSATAPAPAGYHDFEAPPPVAAAPVVPLPGAQAPTARHVQLGAFSSEDSARAAWRRMSQGAGAAALSGLQPAYEAVEVGGRRLVRLKVAATAEQAQVLCRDLAASDPWCARAGGAAA